MGNENAIGIFGSCKSCFFSIGRDSTNEIPRPAERVLSSRVFERGIDGLASNGPMDSGWVRFAAVVPFLSWFASNSSPRLSGMEVMFCGFPSVFCGFSAMFWGERLWIAARSRSRPEGWNCTRSTVQPRTSSCKKGSSRTSPKMSIEPLSRIPDGSQTMPYMAFKSEAISPDFHRPINGSFCWLNLNV